jgi:hypothetical protein
MLLSDTIRTLEGQLAAVLNEGGLTLAFAGWALPEDVQTQKLQIEA